MRQEHSTVQAHHTILLLPGSSTRCWVINGETAPVPAWIPLHHHQSRIPEMPQHLSLVLTGILQADSSLQDPTSRLSHPPCHQWAVSQGTDKHQTHCLLLSFPLVFYLLGPLTDTHISLLFLLQQFCLQTVVLFPLPVWQAAVEQYRACKGWLSMKASVWAGSNAGQTQAGLW